MTVTSDRNDPRINQTKGPGEQNEAYIVLSPEDRAKGFIRPLRSSYIHMGPKDGPRACETMTTMNSQAIVETYARDPKFYGSTWCCQCRRHISVSEFRWLDGEVVGS